MSSRTSGKRKSREVGLEPFFEDAKQDPPEDRSSWGEVEDLDREHPRRRPSWPADVAAVGEVPSGFVDAFALTQELLVPCASLSVFSSVQTGEGRQAKAGNVFILLSRPGLDDPPDEVPGASTRWPPFPRTSRARGEPRVWPLLIPARSRRAGPPSRVPLAVG